jgi:hypothetical protein
MVRGNGFTWFVVGGELRPLMTAAQLTAYLTERGIEPPSLDSLPIATMRRGEPLYSGKDVLTALEQT